MGQSELTNGGDPRTLALIVAAGRGHRLGASLPKQYVRLGGRAILYYTANAFARHPEVDATRVVIHPDDKALYAEAIAGLDLLPSVDGGETRQDSVRLGLESLDDLRPAKVLIHDGARPFVSAAIIARVLAALDHADGAIPALPVGDTLKRGDAGRRIRATVDRSGLWRAQTPQGFRFHEILAAHRAAAGAALTDDAAVAEQAGLEVDLVEGSDDNFKITTEDDLRRAARLLAAESDVCVGHGFDVHRFAPGDHVMLCGIPIPHGQGLAGHSDADVGLHALTDAILGAIGAGDIGEHFPPGEARWTGAPSETFLARAAELVTEAGGRVMHVDVTLICERPKVGPHRGQMIVRIAELLALAPERVSVKATTTERLGFLGRGEGIAAQATATVRLSLR